MKLIRHRKSMKTVSKQLGHISLEVPLVSVLFLVFSYLCADMGYLLYGADLNDRACRDAARAAAQSGNINDAINKVNAVLRAQQGNPLVMAGPSVNGQIVYQNYGGSPPTATSPYVTVTTITTINMPFAPIKLIGNSFGANGNWAFTQSYTYPIVRMN